MAKGKKSFVLYVDLIETWNELSDDQAGKLIKHIYSYVNDENPVINDPLLRMAFLPIKQHLKRDLKAWEAKQEQRKQAGIKSAEARKTKTNTRKRKPTTVKSRSTNLTVNVNGNGNVNGNVNDIYNIFWDLYHKTTSLRKTDKVDAFKNWGKLTEKEMELAINNIDNYFNSLNDKKYCKKARTYLSDKNFNDEYVTHSNPESGKHYQSYRDITIPMPK